VNISGCFNEVIQKLLFTIAINLATSAKDKAYQLELLKVTVDAEKIAKGHFGNIILQSVMSNFYKSIDHKIAFPITKVSINFNSKQSLIRQLFQGDFIVNNFIISDVKIPFNIKTKADFMVASRFVFKIAGKKQMQHLFSFKAYGRLEKL